jgi:hypothetical protein
MTGFPLQPHPRRPDPNRSLYGEVVDVESEQPKTPVQERRGSFFEPRSAASSAAAAAPAPMSIFDDDVNEAY